MEQHEYIVRSLGYAIDYIKTIAPLLVIGAATLTFARLEVRK